MERILIVEDDKVVQRALKRLFESEGYDVNVKADGRSALEAFYAQAPTVVVLDLGLPVMSGQDVCREIRRQSFTVPIIILSALSDVRNKVLLLELGADDFVTKPFSPRELLARVRASIRHTARPDICAQATFNGVCVDFAKMEITLDGQPVKLTALEFKTLRFFIENAHRIVSREELLKEAFGYQDYCTSHTVDNHIYNLRQKLERDPANPIHFCTVRGSGYRFVR